MAELSNGPLEDWRFVKVPCPQSPNGACYKIQNAVTWAALTVMESSKAGYGIIALPDEEYDESIHTFWVERTACVEGISGLCVRIHSAGLAGMVMADRKNNYKKRPSRFESGEQRRAT